MADILAYLFKHAFKNRISCALIWKDANYQSVALLKKLIVINQNCRNKYELPFIVGREIGHIMNGDENAAFYYGQPVNSEERLADLYSLNLFMLMLQINMTVLKSQFNLFSNMESP